MQMGRSLAMLAAIIVLAWVPSFAQVEQTQEAMAGPEYVTVALTEPPDLQSRAARFARVIVSPVHTTALTMILDESRGTGTGYDTLYADLNYDGRMAPDERIPGRVNVMGEIAFASFPAFAVARAENLDEPPAQRARVNVSYQMYGGKQIFSISVLARIPSAPEEPGDIWQYRIEGRLLTGSNPDTIPLTVLGGEPALQVDARPAGYNRREVGIGLTVTLGGSFCDPRGPQGSPDATVVIRDADGELVKQATARLDQFCFG